MFQISRSFLKIRKAKFSDLTFSNAVQVHFDQNHSKLIEFIRENIKVNNLKIFPPFDYTFYPSTFTDYSKLFTFFNLVSTYAQKNI